MLTIFSLKTTQKQYKTYIKSPSATITGRPLGKTLYFTASVASTAAEFNRGAPTLVYPENHHINHSDIAKNQLKNAFYRGSVGAVKVYTQELSVAEITRSIGGVGDFVVEPTQGAKLIETLQSLGSSSTEFPSIVGDEYPKQQVYTINVDGADAENILRVDSVNKRAKRGKKK